jgi:hypothetical protein
MAVFLLFVQCSMTVQQVQTEKQPEEDRQKWVYL